MTASTVPVVLQDARYDVLIERGCLDSVGDLLAGVLCTRRVALITDETVGRLIGMQVDTKLARAGFSVTSLTVPAGETSKSWGIAGELLEELAGAGIGREDAVVALGGGVVGDLAGFVAATYLRGVDFVQIPTTLLAMVDSSVGGKTGIDLRAGKNLAGAFKQPVAVFADTAILDGLPAEQWASGLAEVAKSAMVEGEEFTAWMEQHAAALVAREHDVVDEAVRRSVAFKANVVAHDERESGPRECLNYGHTLGHAIERVAGYGVVTHGAAVAEGMRFAARVAAAIGGAEIAFVRRQDRLLDALGLHPLEMTFSASDLVDRMSGDKKSRGGQIRMVLVREPGAWSCDIVERATLSEHVGAWRAHAKGE